MVEYMKKVIELSKELRDEERNLLSRIILWQKDIQKDQILFYNIKKLVNK